MRYKGFCEYPFARHEANRCDIVSYSDEENGVAKDTPICCGHYWAHLRTYYPGERTERIIAHGVAMTGQNSAAENIFQGSITK